jgi:hypothetical protein
LRVVTCLLCRDITHPRLQYNTCHFFRNCVKSMYQELQKQPAVPELRELERILSSTVNAPKYSRIGNDIEGLYATNCRVKGRQTMKAGEMCVTKPDSRNYKYLCLNLNFQSWRITQQVIFSLGKKFDYSTIPVTKQTQH